MVRLPQKRLSESGRSLVPDGATRSMLMDPAADYEMICEVFVAMIGRRA